MCQLYSKSSTVRINFKANCTTLSYFHNIFFFFYRFYNERKTDGHLDKCLDMAHPVRAFYIQHRVYNEWGAMIEDLKANKTIALQPTVAGNCLTRHGSFLVYFIKIAKLYR